MNVIAHDTVVAYRDEGAGPVILMLHGWRDSLRTFDALVPALAASRRIIRIDLPGFGASETPKTAWRLDDYVRCVSECITKIGAPVDTLIGHSFGGRIAIKGAATNVLPANRVVLIASAGAAKRRTPRNLSFWIAARFGRLLTSFPPMSFWRHTLRTKLYRFAASDYPNPGMLREIFRNIIGEDLVPAAANITKPTLLIWGDRDRITPLAEGERLHNAIHGSRLVVIAGAGHFVHQERPGEVAALIREFMP